MQDVGDVAVREDVARVEAEDGGFGDARVGAAEPEDGRVLPFGEGGEEVGFVVAGRLHPRFVVGERFGEEVCGGRGRVSWWDEVEGVVEGGGWRGGGSAASWFGGVWRLGIRTVGVHFALILVLMLMLLLLHDYL